MLELCMRVFLSRTPNVQSFSIYIQKERTHKTNISRYAIHFLTFSYRKFCFLTLGYYYYVLSRDSVVHALASRFAVTFLYSTVSFLLCYKISKSAHSNPKANESWLTRTFLPRSGS